MTHIFYPGEVYEVVENGTAKLLRILASSPSTGEVATFELSNPNALPAWAPRSHWAALIDADQMNLAPSDPLSKGLRADSSLTPAETRSRDKGWEIIRNLVREGSLDILSGELRGGLIVAAAKQHKTSKTAIYRLLRRYWARGMVRNALVPAFAKCGAPGVVRHGKLDRRVGADRKGGDDPRGGVGVTSDVAAKLREGAALVVKGMTYRKAWLQIWQRHFSVRRELDGLVGFEPAVDRPSFGQFEYHVRKSIQPDAMLKGRLGEGKFDRNHRPKTGAYRHAVAGPGAIYQVDAATAHILLTSHRDPERIIGSVYVYIVVDVCSGLIVGAHVSLKPCSVRVLRLALENAFTDKVAYCASMGLRIESWQWPAHHRCGQLLSDNAPEMTSKFVEQFGSELGIDPAKTKAFRPNLKGLVEKGIDLLKKNAVENQPGAWKPRGRGDERQSVLPRHTLASFRKQVVIWILEENTRRQESWPDFYKSLDGRDPCALDLWTQGCAHFGAPQVVDPDLVRDALLERDVGVAERRGLAFRKRLYVPVLKSETRWLIKPHGGRWHRLEVRYDARRIGEIRVSHKGLSSVWVLHPLLKDMSECSEEEFEEHCQWKLDGNRRARNDDDRMLASLRATARRHRNEVEASLPPGVVPKVGPDGFRPDRTAARLDDSRYRAPAPQFPVPPPPAPAPVRRLTPDYSAIIDEETP